MTNWNLVDLQYTDVLIGKDDLHDYENRMF